MASKTDWDSVIAQADADDSSVDLARAALLIASEHRRTRAGSRLEMLSGDAAAALVIGQQGVLARFVDVHAIASDFVDHYRMDGSPFDYDWEERWVRDEGYSKLVPAAVSGLLEKTGLRTGDIAHFILPSLQKRVPATVAKSLGLESETVVDNLLDQCGQTGVAHPILLLAKTLERAAPGERIVVIGFGQGCDALLFEVTDAIGSFSFYTHYQSISKGLIDARDLVFYLTVIVFFLFANALILDVKKAD